MSGAWGIATWPGHRAQNEIKAPLDGGVRICIFEGWSRPSLVERLDAIDVGGCSLGLRGAAAQAEWRTSRRAHQNGNGANNVPNP